MITSEINNQTVEKYAKGVGLTSNTIQNKTKQNKSPKSRGRRRDNQPFMFNNQNFQTPLDKQNPTWVLKWIRKRKKQGEKEREIERIEWLATKSK